MSPSQRVYGITTATVKVGYEYSGCSSVMWNIQTTKVSGHDMASEDIGGGWQLDAQHKYNFHAGILQKGDGHTVYLKYKPHVSIVNAMVTMWRFFSVHASAKERSLSCVKVMPESACKLDLYTIFTTLNRSSLRSWATANKGLSTAQTVVRDRPWDRGCWRPRRWPPPRTARSTWPTTTC